MGYSGKTADNKTSQLVGVAYNPKAPTLKPTVGGVFNGIKNIDNIQSRTSSPNAENEKNFENVPGGPDQTK